MRIRIERNGQLVEEREATEVEIQTMTFATATPPAKAVDQMTYTELQAEGRRRLAECGGCNRRPDDVDTGA